MGRLFFFHSLLAQRGLSGRSCHVASKTSKTPGEPPFAHGAASEAREAGDRIVAALAKRPGMSQSDVARAMGMSRQLAAYHLAALDRAGRVALVREGRRTMYVLVAKARP